MRMQWSKVKQRVEDRFAPSIANRVAVHYTRYRILQGEYGRGWMTVDKREIGRMSDHTFLNQRYAIEDEITAGKIAFDGRFVAVQPSYAAPRASSVLHRRGTYSGWEFRDALDASLSLSIDDMLRSDNGIIRALAVVDRRCGKRRLASLSLPDDEILLVQALYALRCEEEGIRERRDTAQVDDYDNPPILQ